MDGSGMGVIVVGGLAVIGLIFVALVVAGYANVWRSPHWREAHRLGKTIAMVADQGSAGAKLSLDAFDKLLTLGRSYPSERLVQADVFAAADHLLATIPGELPAEVLDQILAHAAVVIGTAPGRRVSFRVAQALRTLGSSRAHTAESHALHERLATVTPAIGTHSWPNPHEPPPRPAPYRR